MRDQYLVALKEQFLKLMNEMAPRQLVYGELMFFRGMFVGQGATIEEVDFVVGQLHGEGKLPSIFDLIDEQDKELIEKRGAA